MNLSIINNLLSNHNYIPCSHNSIEKGVSLKKHAGTDEFQMSDELANLTGFDEIQSDDPQVAENAMRKLVLSLEDSDIFFSDELCTIANALEYLYESHKTFLEEFTRLYQEALRIIKYDYRSKHKDENI